MELGNMVFGNSRGEVAIPRSRGYEKELMRLFDAIGADSYGSDFDNAIFSVRPYYWGDCTCGFDELDEEWYDTHSHDRKCYQTELLSIMTDYDRTSGYAEIDRAAFGEDRGLLSGMDVETHHDGPVTTMIATPRKGNAMDKWRKAHDERGKYEDSVYRLLCKKYSLSYPNGCAVHCTCAHDADYEKWRSKNDHKPECLLVLPNFLYKPADYRIKWYKYPLRDSYANMEMKVADFRKMIDACIRSVAN